MFKKKITKAKLIKKPTKKLALKLAPKKLTKSPAPIITESLKNKILPLIVEDFIKALKSLQIGESIRFGKLGSFKKLSWNARGYNSIRYKFKPFSDLKK